jgi:hypothetical protein
VSAPSKPPSGPRTQRSSRKRPKRPLTAEDDGDERRFLHKITGFAIEDVGLVAEFVDTGQNGITAAMRIEAADAGPAKFPKTALMLAAERSWRLQDRARLSFLAWRAGHAVAPSLELAIYLASRGDPETAGAVYLAHWRMVCTLHDLIVKERVNYWIGHKSKLGANRKKELAKDFAKMVAHVAAQVIAEHEAEGKKRDKLKTSDVARELKKRLDRLKAGSTSWRMSDSSCWRYVRDVLQPKTKTATKDLERTTERDAKGELPEVSAAELKAMLERAGIKI